MKEVVNEMRESYFLKKIKVSIINDQVNEAKGVVKRIENAANQNPKLEELKLNVQKNYILNEMSSNLGSKDSKLPNVLLGTMEIAGQANQYKKGLRIIGCGAKSINYYKNYLNYYSDYTLDISRYKDSNCLESDLKEITIKAIEKFDVFHFMFGTSMSLEQSDLPFLKESNKKIFMNHWGSDVRQLSIAKKFNPYAVVKNTSDDDIKKKLDFLSKYIDDCIIADFELYENVKEYYSNIHVIRQAIDTNEYFPDPNFAFSKDKPLIVHAPTSSEFKGTRYILKAIEELQDKYKFNFILIQNMSHTEAKRMYQKADIVVDQILGGAHGLLSLEVMSMNKPVICYISDFMKSFYPKEIPIFSANPSNIKERIELLLKDYEMRVQIGLQGRKYVEKYHDIRVVAKDLLKIYSI